jgi:hypothetical protein
VEVKFDAHYKRRDGGPSSRKLRPLRSTALAPVYNWFTEGLDTADLKDAKALLEWDRSMSEVFDEADCGGYRGLRSIAHLQKRKRDRRFAVPRCWSEGDSNRRPLFGLLLLGDSSKSAVSPTPVAMNRVRKNFSVRFFWNHRVETSRDTTLPLI